ncbi:MAG: ddl 2 [Gammaproteobacteria bacterium]|jgi:biotin carboxylase|nr:ddl 2 [Gammaproteobacteria bacterium]
MAEFQAHTDDNGAIPCYLVLQNIVLFRSNWSNISQDIAAKLILIVRQETYTALPLEQRRCFAEVICLDAFDHQTVGAVIAELIATQHQIQRIATHDETCLKLAAQLREDFAIPGAKPIDTGRFIDKFEMKQRLANTDLTIPKHLVFDPDGYQADPINYLAGIKQNLTLPLFIKPIDGAASMHTAKIDDFTELAAWCHAHRDQSNFEIDEFIVGSLYCCESIISQGQIVFAHACRYMYPCFDFTLGKPLGTLTLPQNSDLVQRILQFNASVLQTMQPLPDGVIHLELFVRNNQQLVFVELACRSPGGMVVQTYEKRFNINLEELHFRLQLGLDIDLTSIQQPEAYAAWVWFPYRAGRVAGFKPLAITSPHEQFWKVDIGTELPAPTSLIDYAGGLLLWNNDYAALERDFNHLADCTEPPIVVG